RHPIDPGGHSTPARTGPATRAMDEGARVPGGTAGGSSHACYQYTWAARAERSGLGLVRRILPDMLPSCWRRRGRGLPAGWTWRADERSLARHRAARGCLRRAQNLLGLVAWAAGRAVRPRARGRCPMSRRRYPSDLSDAEWALLAPLLPAAKPGGRP